MGLIRAEEQQKSSSKRKRPQSNVIEETNPRPLMMRTWEPQLQRPPSQRRAKRPRQLQMVDLQKPPTRQFHQCRRRLVAQSRPSRNG